MIVSRVLPMRKHMEEPGAVFDSRLHAIDQFETREDELTFWIIVAVSSIIWVAGVVVAAKLI
jgi:hypothetical protein